MDRSSLLEDDHRARAAALDVGRSFIVQAPAGSGKTELLIQRYLRLLATVTVPEEILAITFTRKAAAEMRLRIVAALEAARAGRREDAPHRQLTAAAAAAVLAADRRLEWGLGHNPGRMRIMTLDALNASIARALPLTAGTGASGAIVEDSEMQAVYRQAAGATLDWLVADGEHGNAVSDVLRHVDGHTDLYIEHLSRMLASRDQWLPFVSSGRLSVEEAAELREDFEGRLATIIADELAGVCRSVPAWLSAALPPLVAYAARNLRANGSMDPLVQWWADDSTMPGAQAADLPRWLALAALLLTNEGNLRRRLDVLLGFPPADDGQKAAMTGVLERLAELPGFAPALAALRSLPPQRYPDEQWAMLQSLFRVLPVATSELRRLFAARGITDHVEVAIAAAAALGTPEEPGNVALLMDYSVRHILVDEMQDTSKAQYRLLESLTAGWEPGDGRTLFCVGDPMQSVYRFRNAEVMQFLRAREQGIGTVALEPLVLRQNFRSGEHLVAWFNRTFPRVFPARDEPVNGAVRHAASVAAPGLAGLGRHQVHPGFGASVEREADQGAAVVAALLEAHPGESIAILVRSRTQLPSLLRQLRARRIPYQSVDIDRMTDLPEILDILALTRALAHRGDRVAWLGVLRGPWIGLDWTDLHTLVAGAREATVLELLRDPLRRTALSATGRDALARALPVIEAALATGRAEALNRRVERCWFTLGGPALMPDADAVDNVYRFLATLARLETGGSLPDVAALYAELDAERVSASTAADVQVLTMHKSKGLEFDHVILYATGRRSAGNRPAIMNWIDLPGDADAVTKLVSPIGRREDVDRDPLHRYIDRMNQVKDSHELARLLYVACTRARRSLHIVGQVALKQDGESYAEPPAGSLLKLLWAEIEPAYAQAFAARQPGTDDPAATVFVPPPYRRLARPWRAPDVAALPVPPPHDAEPADDLRVEYDWVGFEARLAGTVVHRWLHRLTAGPGPLPRDLPPRFDDTSRRWLSELGAAERLQSSVLARVQAAVRSVLRDERGRWLLAGEGEAELALTGSYGGRVQSIVIDRVRIDDEGTHWVVDYKTGTHEGGDLEGFLAAESVRYREQLARYVAVYANFARAPVRCGLYFPLLARFVDVLV